MADPDPRSRGFLQTLFVTGLFSGYSPVAPGTAGSLVGLFAALIPGFQNPVVMGPLIIATYFGGVFVSAGFSTSSDPDPSIVVIDEVVGMWIALFLLPLTPYVLISSFVLFRLCDIVKPFPARQLEQLPGGWGIMTDDVIAGIYANLLTWAVLSIAEVNL